MKDVFPQIEYEFISSDTVEVLFSTFDGKSVVIEIETTDTLPGGHQILKYWALGCADLNKTITSQGLNAVLVAWAIHLNALHGKRFRKNSMWFFSTRLIESSGHFPETVWKIQLTGDAKRRLML